VYHPVIALHIGFEHTAGAQFVANRIVMEIELKSLTVLLAADETAFIGLVIINTHGTFPAAVFFPVLSCRII
jgi:hypothetical protein